MKFLILHNQHGDEIRLRLDTISCYITSGHFTEITTSFGSVTVTQQADEIDYVLQEYDCMFRQPI